ncbi:hypothetical protein PVAP13_2NG236600 [Panicum virgatum]|nr:hypothetical protein PVAP13_2NG236600 [Panicum virgatum]
MEAELYVLRSSSSCHDDGAENSDKKCLPILYQEEDEDNDLQYWDCNEVVPFKNSLFWVSYDTGILFCDGILGDNPKIYYIRFHPDNFVRDNPLSMCKALYRSLCVTDGGCQLVFVDVARHDATGLGPMAPGTGFTMTLWKLKMTGNSIMPWEWMNDAVVTSAELWAANSSEHLPRKVMMLPLVSLDMRNIVHVVLYGWETGSFSLVTIDLSDKQLLGSVVTYIKSSKEGLCTDDADLVRAKPSFFPHFLPSEFPKFLNLNSIMELKQN